MTVTWLDRLVVGLRNGLRRRRAALRDDRGSLPMALLLIMIGMALAAALLPTMIVQDRASVFDGSRMDNLGAAEAGVDVAVGEIRASTTATTSGVVGNAATLPCTSAPTGPIVGRVNGVGKAAYSVTVAYYVVDPVQNPSAAAMVCVAGRGAYDAATASFVPSYALITSTGTDGVTTGTTTGASTGRTVQTTYVFQTINRNIPGGQIRIYPPNTLSTTVNMCMDAGASPTAGTVVILQTCSSATPLPSQQLFFYRSDLTIQLSTASTPSYPNGLCLDTSVVTGAPVGANPIILTPCLALGSPTFSQQWSFNDSGAFEASLPTSAAPPGPLSPYCMAVSTQNAGQRVALDTCANNTSSPAQAWLPSPNVGDGAAASPQLVNYQQFGRCLDITGQNVSATQEIAYPCKQNPYRGAVTWNQLFTFDPVSGWIYTTTGGIQYCLESPRTEGGYVRLDQCSNIAWLPGVTAAQLIWTHPADAAAYPQRYTFIDSSTDAQRCLGISAPPTGDSSPWYYITVSTCNGSTAQKWNGDPNLNISDLQNYIEEH